MWNARMRSLLLCGWKVTLDQQRKLDYDTLGSFDVSPLQRHVYMTWPILKDGFVSHMCG